MKNIFINREIAQLIILQRIELLGLILKKIRKLFGRKFFTNIASKYLILPDLIGKKYTNLMNEEYEDLSKFLDFQNKKILSIGPGMCGLELIIHHNNKNSEFSIIEKNYVSKKVVYGWDSNNLEGYNNLKLVKLFLENNGMDVSKYAIYDYDNDKLPNKYHDYILSLYSLDYHYSFDFYQNYLKSISNNNTKIIFDTIRPNYFKDLFKNVEIIKSTGNTVHKSKRIICNEFKN